ncbi:hypothetical protein [Nocardia sp. NBC_01388]|uniref:hypothetical protein n=1 Tax=Nocardia sp. NBC_01388 TaxID=2903596 RepID=UPI003250FA1B
MSTQSAPTTGTVARPQWRNIASPAQIWLFRMVWSAGALAIAAAVLLLIAAVAADTAAGRNGQPAGVLGLIALAIGGTILMGGLLVRSRFMTLAARQDIGAMAGSSGGNGDRR